MMKNLLNKNYSFTIKSLFWLICAIVVLRFYIYVKAKYNPVLCSTQQELDLLKDNKFRYMIYKYTNSTICFKENIEGIRHDISVWDSFINNIQVDIDRINTLYSNNVPYINTDTTFNLHSYREHIDFLTQYREYAEYSKRKLRKLIKTLY